MVRAHRVQPSVLEHLGPAYHQPEVLAVLEVVRRIGRTSFSELGTEVTKGTTPSTLGFEYHADGIPFIRSQDVLASYIREPSVFISDACDFAMRRSRIKRGDLLLSIVGASIGRAAVYHKGDRANTNQAVAVIRIGDTIDGDYVASWLATSTAQLLFAATSSGQARDNLDLYQVREFPIPEPSPQAQRYIGDKIRQAERLRARARTLEARVAKVHASYIPHPVGIDFGKCTRRLPSRGLTERLDAHYYPAAVEQYLRQVGGQQKSLGTLTALVTNGQTQPEATGGVFQATVANLGRSFLDGEFRTVERPMDSSRLLCEHDLLLCNAAHTKGYIGRDITYCQVDGGVYPSTEVMVIRIDREQVPASFVRQYLTSRIGFLQIQATIRGISAHSYPADVKLIKLPIPNVSESERAGWFATDDMMLRAGRCFDAAYQLTAAAAQLVELLIEGWRSEIELIAAQKGLDCGDRSADRSLLQALVRRANGDEAPLFNDLDALYALLDEVDDTGAGG